VGGLPDLVAGVLREFGAVAIAEGPAGPGAPAAPLPAGLVHAVGIVLKMHPWVAEEAAASVLGENPHEGAIGHGMLLEKRM